MKKGKIV